MILLAAPIAGAIAEGFYGVPDELKQQCKEYLDDALNDILVRFDTEFRRHV